ncbi:MULTISPECIES: thioredoxin family protein [Halolamina]|uniref:AhpC/TSA family protein n=1 Tax=Halolamina pelagica TaxID=699431 RepID=A0A1I5MH77_9EURY|nr:MULTISPECIES: thioredoxin family protein [Halolamina]NHX36024.1 thioredoxin family protein [Halolamina sp. R1-12]SFP08890.1 AhpC/TSA family protein [Halolamina pelagica]
MVAKESESELDRGDEAPSFSLPGTDGETYSLDSFGDSDALLLVFTCNHCPYARAKFDLLNDLAAEYDDAAVVGINPNDAEEYPEDSFEKMRASVDSGEIAYDAYLRDESQEVAAAYGATCTPDPFLFRNEGDSWVLAYHGRLDDALNPDEEPSEFYIRDAIDAVLAGEAVEIPDRPSRGCSIKWT